MCSARFQILAAISCLLAAPVLAQTAPHPGPAQQPAATTAQAASPGAAGGSCSAQATDKKLAGAAKTSFLKKCESDASKACEAQAGEKKLAGAAKASFTKKCVSDAVGT
ncbi:hypothetical protein [Microvirga massiliensis]|uniref:hypothetical protein n=1 Tax=Microvirga massiliensis TaxID=1033741 RepID=UPI0009E3A147